MSNDIPIIADTVESATAGDGALYAMPKPARLLAKSAHGVVNIDDVRIAIANICKTLSPEQFSDVSGLVVEEVELAFVVTAAGGVRLLGEVSAGMEASIKIKLKRHNP